MATLTFRYLLIAEKPGTIPAGVHQETNDVEAVLETARVMLLHDHDVTITVRREE
jgi:hypothetical protein